MRGLSERQRQVLEVIREYISTRGYPPSIRDITAIMGLQSASTVLVHLRALERKGYIRRSPGIPRAVVPANEEKP